MLYMPHRDVTTPAFCGPTAISAITGVRISKIEAIIRKSRGHSQRRKVKGVSEREILSVMYQLDWELTEHQTTSGFTMIGKTIYLGDVLRFLKQKEGSFIVDVFDHVLAVSEGEICDPTTHSPIPIKDFKFRVDRKVEQWFAFKFQEF